MPMIDWDQIEVTTAELTDSVMAFDYKGEPVRIRVESILAAIPAIGECGIPEEFELGLNFDTGDSNADEMWIVDEQEQDVGTDTMTLTHSGCYPYTVVIAPPFLVPNSIHNSIVLRNLSETTAHVVVLRHAITAPDQPVVTTGLTPHAAIPALGQWSSADQGLEIDMSLYSVRIFSDSPNEIIDVQVQLTWESSEPLMF